MSQNPENEEILNKAEAIFEESRQNARTLTVAFPVKDAILIASAPLIFISNHDESEDGSETAGSIQERFENAFKVGREQNPIFPGGIISVDLSAKDLDFINEVLFDVIHLSRQAGKSTSLSGARQITLSNVKNAMAAIIQLNTAFVNAGGLPRPAFARFHEGNQF